MSSGWTWVWIIAGLGAVGLVNERFFGEQEGIVNTADCRTRVLVKESDKPAFKKFTCTYRRTQSGLIISGVCEAVDISGGTCETVYTYTKKVPDLCTDPKFPYAGIDDKCYNNPQ